jgi:hypothetical protein
VKAGNQRFVPPGLRKARPFAGRLLCRLFLGLLFVSGGKAQAGLDTANPIGFFTNLASRLLQSELNLSLTRIQIYPTNQYTPAVHRLLQVTANLYDATTNRTDGGPPYLPTVFRQVFTNDGGSIFIAGFVEVTNTDFLSAPLRDLSDPAQAAALQPNDLVYGVPLVIGAKKGFPNFNEFSMQSEFQITRKLQVTRPSTNAPLSQYHLNQMYVMSVTNLIGVEFWNSYRTNYTRPVTITVVDNLTMALTNNDGMVPLVLNVPLTGGIIITGIGTNVWPGYGPGTTPDSASFQIPLYTNAILLPNAVYRFATHDFTTNLASGFETTSGLPVLQWGLQITNRLRAMIIDTASGRLIDYVQLNGLNGNRNLSQDIATTGYGYDGLWNTNLVGSIIPGLSVPQGIEFQIDISLGNIDPNNTVDWNDYGLGQLTGKNRTNVIAGFKAFIIPGIGANTNLQMQVPFSPTRMVCQYLTWQANDPLIHYTSEDLTWLQNSNGIRYMSLKVSTNYLENLGRLNNRFQPWGGKPDNNSADTNAFNLAIKDPSVWRSDDWSFPEGQPLDFALLGRIHRGTPWQTVFLKSTNVLAGASGLNTWMNWTGIADPSDALRTVPTSDWRLASPLLSLLNTNNPHQLLSVNEPDTNAWLSALDGTTVLTNTASDDQLLLNRFIIPPPPPPLDTLIMSTNSPQAASITDAIAEARAEQPGQRFFSLGDILATPELSAESPWLNLSTSIQAQYGITDEAYEKIPSQLLPRLRPDSLGAVVLSNGDWHVEFTGFDGYPYAVENSTNLVDWAVVSTNYPSNGMLDFVVTPSNGPAWLFYRSVLLP